MPSNALNIAEPNSAARSFGGGFRVHPAPHEPDLGVPLCLHSFVRGRGFPCFGRVASMAIEPVVKTQC
jgi:hypothetical protein